MIGVSMGDGEGSSQMAGTTSQDWTRHSGTLRTAEPLRADGRRGRRGVEILLKNLKSSGAAPWMIRSVEESLREPAAGNGRR